ncbi:tripartite tricarboxylate transporter substrate binding protein [Xylophilus ampelinus]|nr:tripartite tricarboxylate transporter substrate binding protein [Xylophilus ampelinus]MCS4509523.1 tripartite tricarboxylate transporter substrate binding protein [Xylophilus ampelinus]
MPLVLSAQDPPAGGGALAPLRLVVPFTAGTGIDLVARSIGPRLGERLGRPVVVDNRPGASGNIGTDAVVRAVPNGATLLVTVSTLVMNRSLYPQLPFDPLKDLVPVSQTSWGQLVLVASPQSGLRTAADLLAAARARPGRLNYASPGVGTPHHLAMELLKTTARVSITHIPYRGTAPAVTDLLGGQVDVMFLPIHVALAHLKAGKLQGLGIGAERRHPLLPDLPTLREARAGDVNVTMWYGIFAPPRTPPEWVASLNHTLQGILALQELRTAFQTQGMDPMGSTPEAFGRMVAEDAERWARVVRTQNIKPEGI